ncbi:MAG: hypothetical protein CMH82_00010 [Nocardioides sp.]|nr:hypothetical protein [Nocardioides sp.]
MTEQEEKEYVIPKKRKKLGFGGTMAVVLIVAAGVLFAAYPLIFGEGRFDVETSDSKEFQDGFGDSPFGRIDGPDEPDFSANSQSSFDIGPLQDQLSEQEKRLQEENDRLKGQLDSLQGQLDSVREEAGAAAAAKYDELLEHMKAAQALNEKTIAALEKRLDDQENDRRMSEAEAAAEAARRKAAAEAAAAREAQLKSQIASPAVIFDQGQNKNGVGGSAGDGTGLGNIDPSRAFVENGAAPVKVETADVIANPSNTVLQGTIIRATLQNAVSSDTPGQVSALVTSPIYSFDGTQILIPSGARVFGQYSSDVRLGQKRILIGWTRIVTPEGQSVQIAAYGGDSQGRSGITGDVNNHFGQRFGGAALVSLISATPQIAAALVSDNNEIAVNTGEDVGDDLSNTTADVMNEYIKIPPTISVEQGSVVSIMVDRDLEFF